MIKVTDEELMAYADGELSPGETATLDTLLALDAQLRARLAPFIVTRDRLATAFEPTLHEPVPARLVAAIRNAPVAPRKAPSARAAMDLPFDGLLRALGAALFPSGLTPATAFSAAALLAVGAGAGWIVARSAEAPDLVVADDAGLIASQEFARVLEGEASRTIADVGSGRSVTPVQSFRTHNKGVCREYVVGTSAATDFAGVACRTPTGEWRVALHVATPKPFEAEGQYVTAGHPSPPAVEELVKGLISGDALDGKDEGALLLNGWRATAPAGRKPEHGP